MYNRHPRLLRLWQKIHCVAFTVEGEAILWSSDDIHLRKRKIDWEIGAPKWPWRLYCLIYSHEPYYGACVHCNKIMPGKG